MIGNNLLLGSGDEGYNLTRSLRFRSSASAYLNRTPASATNRKTYTWSGWVKRGILSSSTRYTFFASSSGGANNFTSFSFDSDNIRMLSYNGGSKVLDRASTPVYRDPSAWYHIVVAVDMTQATATNRQRVYVNNVEITAWTNTTTLSQNSDTWINYNQAHYIARDVDVSTYFDGYATEVNFIDGSQLTPSSFGETDTITGVWKPKAYSGTYGTNGFELQFTDNSAATAAAIGKDSSGNGNNWTPNNISITAGVTYDSMTDVPTLTSATAANFPTLNPLNSIGSSDISAGNLTRTGGNNYTIATMGMPSGKWYAEMTVTTVGTESSCGVATKAADNSGSAVGTDSWSWGYINTGLKYNNATTSSYGASYTSGDVIGIAFDNTIGTLTFYKNNVSQGAAFTGLSANTYFFAMEGRTSGTPNNVSINFGQRPFTYTPPTGFVALNTYNLPTSTIVKGNTVMDATTYTGTGASTSITNAGAFKPDLVWIKSRAQARSHRLQDSVRGVGNRLASDQTAAETVDASSLTSFDTGGFSLGTNINYNTSAEAFVAWQWQAGQGSSSSNTNGTITSTVSVNASAGFSVVTYTGTGANATVGHGLGVAPQFIIVKNRSVANGWFVGHSSSLTPNANAWYNYLQLQTTDAGAAAIQVWNATAPTSSVFSIGTGAYVNGSGNSIVAYCWTPIAGYSAFGSYTGNGSTDGTFVYTGFRPKFVLVKSSSLAQNWTIYDTSRNPYNAANLLLYPLYSNAEDVGTGQEIDLLSNGFKLRNSNANENTNGATYIYMAYAENPFKNSLAR